MEYQTPSLELRARVALEKHRFHKTHSLGQNFLLSESMISLLLDDAEISPEDNVLEIGPGAGVMTRLMARRARRVLALELDRGLEPVLSQVLEGIDNARVVYVDAMKADLKALNSGVKVSYFFTSDSFPSYIAKISYLCARLNRRSSCL